MATKLILILHFNAGAGAGAGAAASIDRQAVVFFHFSQVDGGVCLIELGENREQAPGGFIEGFVL